MAQVDPNRIINKLALKLAQREIDLAIAECAAEDARANAAKSQSVDVSSQPVDVSAESAD